MSWLKFNSAFEYVEWKDCTLSDLHLQYALACNYARNCETTMISAREEYLADPKFSKLFEVYYKTTLQTYKDAFARKLRCIEEIAAKEMERDVPPEQLSLF